MDDSHDDVIAATRDFIEASVELREVLAFIEVGLLKGIEVLERGGTPMDNLRTPFTARQRSSMQSALDHLAGARHTYRSLMIAECVKDGMKARELSETWGFSRQRASKLIQEANGQADADTPGTDQRPAPSPVTADRRR
jgi:predicted transcriptional regulator